LNYNCVLLQNGDIVDPEIGENQDKMGGGCIINLPCLQIMSFINKMNKYNGKYNVGYMFYIITGLYFYFTFY